jgi:hypothetical protein
MSHNVAPSQEDVGDLFDPENLPQQSEVVTTRLLIGPVAYAMFRNLSGMF